jgi:HD-like signal output (HDOD) protein
MKAADAAPRDVSDLLGQGISIPAQPRVLAEIEQLARQENVSVKAIATLIGKDPGIAASLFKMANSPAMGLSRRIETVESAVAIMGIPQVTNVIKGVAIRQTLAGSSPAYEVFWERANDIAQIAAAVAASQGSAIAIRPDQAFMAGLFHDCGVPVLMQKFPDYCKTFRTSRTAPWPDLTLEDEALKTDHCVVGYMVGKHWALPEIVQWAIRYHHEAIDADHPARAIVALLQFSTYLYRTRYQLKDEAEWITGREAILEELGLSLDGLNEFSEEITDRLNA